MALLSPGDKAPDFSLVDQNDKTVKLSDFRGRKLLVYFYPKAMTSSCTTQALNVRDAREKMGSLGASVVGISPDLPDQQKKFDEKYGLGFPLLSDGDHAVAQAYGAWGEKSMYGKKYEGIIRSSFLISEEGNVIEVWYRVKPKDTAPKACQILEG
jgi:peroxiredoxin Q/BCP